ncbi:MAG: mannose-1-phosphate guanylyltransferase [Candidatus Doudnabacteria bacterium]|nr:mannose-1-phosphate guanylyltransferase [Candidatus Doudnabacteria bacterium]
MKIVILAGGLGQRLWPLSRAKTPKHFLPLIGKSTLLQQTFRRLRRQIKASDIFIVTNKDHARLIRRQLPSLPKKNLIVEPRKKGTAGAIGLAAYRFAKENPEEVMISIAADHYIGNERSFLSSLATMGRVIRKKPEAVCLLGIKPSYPETGYGYIRAGAASRLLGNTKILKVEKFIEKPKLAVAQKLASSKHYYWNPSYFAWRVDRVQELFKKLAPDLHRCLLKTAAGRHSAYKKMKNQAIEYAVVEKLRENFFVIPARFGWADVGHWASVKEIRAKSSQDNVTLGVTHALDTKNSLIYNYSPALVTTIGVSDLLIVQTRQGTLVCHKDRAQDVKQIVENMSKNARFRKFF